MIGRAAIAGLVALAAFGETARAATPVDALLARIEAQSRDVGALQGEFTQKNRVRIFKQELSSRGRFYFQRPRKIRWEYLAPDPSVLLLDGEVATLRAPGAPPQTFDLKRDAVMRTVFDQLLLWLGSGGLEQAKRDYAIETAGGDAPTLVLTPHAGGPIAKAFARIELRLDKKLLLSGILLREPSGDEKEIVFSKMERNGKLPPGAFTP